MSMELDDLFAIAEAEPLLARAEEALRQAGQNGAADALLKLQQDAGLEIDREMGGASGNEPPAGPETARLANAYQPLSADRVGRVLRDASAFFPDPELKALMQVLRITELPPAATAALPPRRGPG